MPHQHYGPVVDESERTVLSAVGDPHAPVVRWWMTAVFASRLMSQAGASRCGVAATAGAGRRWSAAPTSAMLAPPDEY